MLSLMRDLKRGLCFFFPPPSNWICFLTPCKHKRYNCITVESSLLMHPPPLDNLHLSTKAPLSVHLCVCVCACPCTLAHAHARVPLAQCYCHNPTPSPLSFSFLFFMRNVKEKKFGIQSFILLAWKMTLLHKLIYYGELYLFVWPHH